VNSKEAENENRQLEAGGKMDDEVLPKGECITILYFVKEKGKAVKPLLKCPLVTEISLTDVEESAAWERWSEARLGRSGSVPEGWIRTSNKVAERTYPLWTASIQGLEWEWKDRVGLSGRGTGIPIYGQTSRIARWAMCRKALTKRGFKRILLGTGVAPKKGYNDYGHPKTIQRKG
jgi:hypothetical protein